MNVNQKATSKPLHSNINDLVDLYQTQSCLFTRSQSINLPSNNRPKTMSMHRLTLAQINNPVFRPLNIQNGHFVHTRSMSNVINRGLQTGNRQGLKTSQQTRKQKMINMLSTQNFRKQLMNTRKMSAVQTQYRSVDVRNRNNKKDYDLRFNVLQNNYELQKEGTSKQSTYDKNSNFQSRIQGQFYQQRIDSIQNQRAHDLRNPLSIDKHEYLRKNSSINKSILNTILKQKMARQLQTTEKDKQQIDPTKNIRNEQIVKMIKVYKGIQPIVSVRQKNEQPTIELKAKENKKKDLLYIQGWQNQTEDFEFNRSHGPEQNASSHVQLERQIQIKQN